MQQNVRILKLAPEKSVYLLAFLALPVYADEVKKAPVQAVQVVVNGGISDTDAARDFIAGKILIGKKRIAESGARDVAEILRREPAITVGKNGQLGLLGLPGYTQILVDGLPPDGADPMSLDLVHVENIEIIKSATAANGPFGIAGTINIVRRKAERKTTAQLRADTFIIGGKHGADLSLSSNRATEGSPLIYSLSLSARRRNTPSQVDYTQVLRQSADQSETRLSGARDGENRADSLNVSGEFAWSLSPEHKLSFSPNAGRLENTSNSLERRQWDAEPTQTLAQRNKQPLTVYGIPLLWNWKINADSRLKVRLHMNSLSADVDNTLLDARSGSGVHVLQKKEQRDIRNHFLDLDYNTEYPGGHEIAAGFKLARNRGSRDYTDLIDGMPDSTLSLLGNTLSTLSTRYQAFIQDDWRINRSWAAGAGLSTEYRTYKLHEGTAHDDSNFNIWSPTLHISHRINGDRKRQFRMSLARTFQAPTVDQMVLRPRINALAQCYGAQRCGANTPETSDGAGNPQLQPERALGVNLSYTHGFGKGSEAVVELYSRKIRDKISTELALENVAWASVPRYVSRPGNIGGANVYGVNFEGRLGARDLWQEAPNLELSGSLGFAHSELTAIPGPDNRLSGQSPWRAKLAMAYTSVALPLKMNIDANWLPADWTRQSLTERVYQGGKFTLNANTNWGIAPGVRLKLNLENLFPQDWNRIDEYTGAEQSLHRSSNSAAFRRVVIGLDMTL